MMGFLQIMIWGFSVWEDSSVSMVLCLVFWGFVDCDFVFRVLCLCLCL